MATQSISPAGAGFESVRIDVHGIEVHARLSRGGGERDIVLVHGLGLSHRYMMPVARELSRDFRVLVPDLPGFGLSQRPRKALTIPELADGLAGWMREVGVGPVPLLGNSQGCQVIASLAVRHPDLVAAAILQGPTSPPEERTWLRQAIRWRQNSKFNPPELDAVTWPEYRQAGHLRVLATFRHSLNHAIEEELPRIRAPVLVVRGALDPICHVGWARSLAARAPRGAFVELPEVAHTLVFNDPEVLAEATRTYLKSPGTSAD